MTRHALRLVNALAWRAVLSAVARAGPQPSRRRVTRRSGVWRLAAAAGAGAAATGLIVVIALGLWNLSAAQGHPRIVYDAIAVARDASIAIQTRNITVPSDFEPALSEEGARLYQAHCVTCHGAPGVAPSSLALGMNPLPTPIVAAARARPAREIFWLVKNGLRMTGMPAWDVRLTEAQMWTVTAFTEALPDVSPAQYKTFVNGLGEELSAPPDMAPDKSSPMAPDNELVVRGERAIRMYGCHGCHDIPGIVGHETAVGPRLEAIGEQRFLAGVLPNTEAAMVRWLMEPTHVDPLTAMPDLNVTRQAAEAMAAFLYAGTPPERHAHGDEGGTREAVHHQSADVAE